MTARALFEVLRLALVTRRAAFRRRLTVAFAVVDGGVFVLDTDSPNLIDEGYRTGCDVSILCNTLTLHDILNGDFDLEAPRPHHLFRWGGDRRALQTISRVLSGGRSLLATRIENAP